VPVILIFTKFESEEAYAFDKLQMTCSLDDALAQAPQEARQEFEQNHLSRFKDRKYPPKEVIYLKSKCLLVDHLILVKHQCCSDMDKEDAQCSEVIELTTKALNNDTLRWLLTTVQEVNLRFRMEEMLKM
jgi:hypothetical protein